MGFCHGMFHRIVMDLIGFVGVIFLGLHGISWGIMGYIYIYYPFCLVCLGVFWGYSWKNMCLKHHQLGIECDLMDVCRLVICYMAMA